jgi:eukaryotic-like serine/threonine-protein kinase
MDTPPALDLGNGIKLELISIPEGRFVMGSPANEKGRGSDEGPQHEVTISQRFYMGKVVVTRDQYDQVMGTKSPSGYYPAEKSPANCVSWHDAQDFSHKLTTISGKTVRLPTEAEWEYACRAGSTTAFCFGDNGNELGDYAWYSANSNYLENPVGEKKPNGWGLCDMHGNMLEWCQDANAGKRPDFTDNHGYVLQKVSGDWKGDYVAGPVADPVSLAKGEFRVLRGGSFLFSPDGCRSAFRYYGIPSSREAIYGFRVIVAV